ncbi:MAG TPA: SDR family oxidoreductase [Candidatus Kapabacteria bacterium]|nr:SDR family oxidoreductase [Candidatus Kapabacteria bacterium]
MSENLALITGAGRGIGRAIALRLSHAGIPVVLVARTSEEITALRNEIIERGGKAYATPCDITISSEVHALRDDIASELGTVTILVNNAGIAPSSKFESVTDDVWRETFAVNVDGAFYMTRAFLPGMIAASVAQTSVCDFHVISNASTAALEGFRYTAAYTASKHALLGMMRALAEEFRKTNVKFSTICPGFTRTQILSEAIQATMSRGATLEKAEAMFAMMNREGRIIEPEEIAETVYRLIADPDIPSGQIYQADGTAIGM